MLDAFEVFILHQTADVIFKRIQADIGVRCHKRLLCNGIAGIESADDAPSQAVQHVEQVGELGFMVDFRTSLQPRDIQNVSGDLESGALQAVRAVDYVVCIQRLRQSNGAGARRAEGERQAQMVECVETVGAVDGQETR